MAGISTGIELQDSFSNVLYSIIDAVNLAVYSMDELQQGMNVDIDTNTFQGITDAINEATMELNELNSAIESTASATRAVEPVQIPVQWQSDGLEVFGGSGMERFEQEIQSTNQMLSNMHQMQAVIDQTAGAMHILPDTATQDIGGLVQRMQVIQQQIQQIESNPIDMGTDTVNAQLEHLRSQLNQIIQEQNNLVDAMSSMDVSATNTAYMRLSQTISNTERYIRDNIEAQEQFNQQIRDGTSTSGGFFNSIKGIATAYLTLQSAKQALSLSDELTQTTARLNLMNDGMQSTQELVNMVYASAQDARGSFSEMADVVARFGNNARDAFSSSQEVVAFANLIQKQMTIAGASTQEAENAMLQLSQALGSGVLRGDELNSIFEQAPNLIQNIADYMDVPIGQIRNMASEGQLSADIVKSAIFAASNEINAEFESIPMTWAQVGQSIQNTALIAFQPVLQLINDLANSEVFQSFVDGAIQAISVLASVVSSIFNLIGTVGGFIADNWSIIGPIVYGVIAALAVYAAYLGIIKIIELASAAASAVMAVGKGLLAAAIVMTTGATWANTTAQLGLNGAMYACPLVWMIFLVIALIAVIFAVCNAIAKMSGTAVSGFSAVTGCIFVVGAFFKNLGMLIANFALGVGMAINALGQNIMAAFQNAISAVKSWWYDLLSTCLSVIESICVALNKLPFVEFDYSGIASAADEYAAKSREAAGDTEEYTSISDAFNEGWNSFDAFQPGWAQDAFNAGAEWGDDISDKVNGLLDMFNTDNIPNPDDYTDLLNSYGGDGTGNNNLGNALDNSGVGSGVSSIADNTGAIRDSLDITQEDLKYLRDIAEQETVNRFTVAEVNIDQSGMKNTIKSNTDLDGIVSHLTGAVNEAVDIITEGVHA